MTFKDFIKNDGPLIEGFNPYEQNPFEDLDDKTLIFFDTETTGYDSQVKTRQITEIAAIAVDGKTFQEKAEFHEFIKLSPETLAIADADEIRKKEKEKEALVTGKPTRFKGTRDILAMTGYEEGLAKRDEKTVLKDFVTFITSQPNVILVAHNASFDMKFINVRSPVRLPTVPVYDTLKFARFLTYPTIYALGDTVTGKKKAAELKALIARIPVSKKQEPSSTLDSLTKTFDIKNENWHSAIGDVKTLIAVFKKMKKYYNDEIINTPEFRKHFTPANVKEYGRSTAGQNASYNKQFGVKPPENI